MSTSRASRFAFAPALAALVGALPLMLQPSSVAAAPALGDPPIEFPCKVRASISSNFNGTPIQAGRRIWFNSVVKVKQRDGQDGVVRFGRSVIEFTAAGVLYRLDVPPAVITFDPNATQATTDWVETAPEPYWNTTVPVNYSGNVFLTGLAWCVAPGNLPGGINPVTWSGVFDSDLPNLEFQWKWAAAVYTTMSLDGDEICVKPIDGSSNNPYPNSHHAGSPECWLQYVTGGARGGGGSNFTGSYSGTQTARCTP